MGQREKPKKNSPTKLPSFPHLCNHPHPRNFLTGDCPPVQKKWFTLSAPMPFGVNVDGEANVTDATTLVNHILGSDVYPLNNDEVNANANPDAVIDVTVIITSLLTK